MISGKDFYNVMTGMVPLYVAMILGYGSLKWWKLFTNEQCSGINKFVATFAVPLLSFHFISTNNPFTMNYKFILADTLQKLFVLLCLTIWLIKFKGSIEWYITFFSLSTLPNTLIMGIPLLEGMYGGDSSSLMTQIVALQSIVWYTLMLFLFEFRGARLLINNQFPSNGDLIRSIKVDSDVVSLDEIESLETRSQVMEDGKLCVQISRSTSNFSRIPYFSDVEIYSLPSLRNQSYKESSLQQDNFNIFLNDRESGGDVGPQLESLKASGGPLSRVYPRPLKIAVVPTKTGLKKSCDEVAKDVEMIRSTSAPLPRGTPSTAMGAIIKYHQDIGASNAHPKDYQERKMKDINSDNKPNEHEFRDKSPPGLNKLPSINELQPEDPKGEPKPSAMPSARVMLRLILIMVLRKLIRNPNTYGSIIGLIWSFIAFRWHIEMPKIISASIAIVSDTGIGMATFSLGLFMASQPKFIVCGKAKASIAAVVRFLLGPVVMGVVSAAIGIRGDLLRIAIVQAALPAGIVPFVYAKEYNVHPDILSTSVIFGMLIAVPVTLIYYILLGLVH